MPTFDVEFSQRLSVTVPVVADTAEAAAEIVNRRGFELPPREEWTGHKDGYIRVYGADGEEAHEIEF